MKRPLLMLLATTCASGWAKDVYFQPPAQAVSESWAIPSNWVLNDNTPLTVLPEPSDNRYFNTAKTLENDIDDLSAASILMMATSGAYVLNGKPIALPTDGVIFMSKTALTVNADLTFSAADGKTVKAYLAGETDFNGLLTLPNAITFSINSGEGDTIFNNTLAGEKATLNLSRKGAYRFYKPFRVKNLSCSEYNAKSVHLHCAGNLISGRTQIWMARIETHVDNAFDEASVLGFVDSGYKENNTGTSAYFFLGHDQVANRIESGKSVNYGKEGEWRECDHLFSYDNGTTAKSMTLTLKGTADAQTWACIKGALSVVWAPKGDFTQTFQDRSHQTTGSLAVQGGSLKMAGTCSFAKVPSITVGTNARFDMASTGSKALASVKSLVLGPNGVFATTAAATDVFDTSAPTVRMASSARLVVPSGASLSIGPLFVDGVPLAAGTYTGQGGTSGTALSVIDGTGTVTVGACAKTCWTGAKDDKWKDAANWSAGVPDAAGANVFKYGTYSIDASADNLAQVGDFTMDVAQGLATLSIGNAMDFSAGLFTLGQGAAVVVTDSGSFLWNGEGKANSTATETFVVGPEASFTTAGGTVLTNMTGLVSVKGEMNVTGGALDLHTAKASRGHLSVGRGGSLNLSGEAEVVLRNKKDAGNPPFSLDGGSVTLADAAVFHSGTGWDELFGGGTVVCSNSARIAGDVGARVTFCPHAADNRLTMTMRDQARFDFTSDNNVFFSGADADSETAVLLDSDATHNFGYTYVGHDKGIVDIELRRGTFSCCAQYSGLFIGGRSVLYHGTTGTSSAKARFEVSGGKLLVSGIEGADYRGLILGAGEVCTTGERIGSGELVVSGGSVEMTRGPTVIGVGRNSGRIVVTGGSVVHQDASSSQLRPLTVGWANGLGELVLSNGTYGTHQNVYVGGMQTNVIRWAGPKSSSGQFDAYGLRHDATGVVSIACADAAKPCSFTTTGDLIVGSDGVGELFFSGEGGLLNVRNVILSNQTASAVSFVLGTKGVSHLEASGSLSVASGARLTVDASAYVGPRSRVKLLSANGMNGRFASERIVLVKGETRDEIVQDDQGVWFHRPRGLVILLR